MNNKHGLYVHIPFCQHICTYCDFYKLFYQEDMVDRYLDALAVELKERVTCECPDTIYIGGGTPSTLTMAQLEKLLTLLDPYTSRCCEYTIEVNPESVTREKISLLKQHHVDRLSIGVQTFNEQILKDIDRHHCNEDVFRVVAWAKNEGLTNISIDLMYDLPGQTLQDIERDLSIALSLPLTHLSYYALILEEKTKLYWDHRVFCDDETLEKMEILIRTQLQEAGFIHYEISNYAKEGYMSKHNCLYWENEHYDGIGIGSSGYVGHMRYTHRCSLQQYLRKEFDDEKEYLTLQDEAFNAVMLGLRMRQGIHLKTFKERYKIDLERDKQDILKKYQQLNMLDIENGYLKPTERGMDLLHEILLEFMEESS